MTFTGSGRLAPAFRALQHRNYRLWFFGQGVSLVGTWMQTMAQQVLVYRLTGSASALGIVSFMTVLPLLPFSLWGGSLSDRLPKRTLLLVTQTLMLVQAVVLTVLTWTGAVQVWQIYLMAFLLGVLRAVDMPARQSFVVEMVEGRQDLTNAIGLNSAIHNGSRTLGPALAGVAIAALGEAAAFALNSLSFLAVIFSLVLMRGLPAAGPSLPDRKSAAGHVLEGVRFVLRQQVFLVLMSLVAVSSFLSRPYQTLMPVFAGETLHASAQPVVRFLCEGQQPILRCLAPEALPLGMLLSSVGVGAVTGAFLVATLPADARRGRVLTLGNLAFPVAVLGFVSSRSLLLSMLLLVCVGVAQVLQNALANTLLQTSAPDHLRGRVMSQYALVSQGMTHIGALQAGFAADWIGAPLSVGIGAGVSLAYGLFVALRYPRLRGLR